MTKNEFLQFLDTHLDFLTPEEKRKVLFFCEKKLEGANSTEEEERIVSLFGPPDDLIASLKAGAMAKKSSSDKTHVEQVTVSEENDDGENENTLTESAETEEGDVADDLIFSRPLPENKLAELVQTIEEKEVKPLYGDKVVIEDRVEPVQEFVLEPIDAENNLTPEEIELAKAETLKKTQSFSSTDLQEHRDGEVESENENTFTPEAKKYLIEEDDSSIPEVKMNEDTSEERTVTGLFPALFEAIRLPGQMRTLCTFFLTFLLSPVLLLVFGISALLYVLLGAALLFSAVVMFLFMVSLVVAGVLELIYGCLVLFKNIPAALIELGLGTILFSLVIAVNALIYEFIFAVVPKTLKKITRFFVKCCKGLWAYLYGGKV